MPDQNGTFTHLLEIVLLEIINQKLEIQKKIEEKGRKNDYCSVHFLFNIQFSLSDA